MALSGSYDFSVDRNTLIAASLRLIGVGVQGETPTTDEISEASEALNLMLKAWMKKDGVPIWKRATKSITLVASQGSYALQSSGGDVDMQPPLRILSVVRQDTSNIDTPLNLISRMEYEELPNKYETGTPVSWHYQKNRASGTLYVWPEPDTTAASEYTLEIVYGAPFDDMDASTNDFDCPPEWLETIKYGLAVRLAPEYGVSLDERSVLKGEFRNMYEEMLMSDVEYGSLYLQPEWSR